MTDQVAPKPTPKAATIPAAPPATTPATTPPVVPSANGATPPDDDAAAEVISAVTEFVAVSDHRLAYGLLLIGIGLGAAVVYFVLTRVIIEDTDHA